MSTNPKAVPCPLCGSTAGMFSVPSQPQCWWGVICGSCDEQVAEIRVPHTASLAERDARCIAAWNRAGAYAEGMRKGLEALRSERSSRG
jgi:hypothetical protein